MIRKLEKLLFYRFLVGCCRFTMHVHRMVDIGETKPEPVCFSCETPWPCDEFIKAENTLRKLQNEYT